MNPQEKVRQLRDIIRQRLTPLIKGDYLLADAPYHSNIGDSLIWHGELDFLSTLPGRNLGTSNPVTFTFPEVSGDVTILLQGGGSFGDLWRYYDEFRMKVVRHYHGNPIVVFPQSVWYDDITLAAMDAEVYAAHPNLWICVRDRWSYDFMVRHFPKVRVMLVPDMAFFMSEKILDKWRGRSADRNLFLLRTDKELVASYADVNGDKGLQNYDVRDWPTREREPKWIYWLDRFSYAFSWRLKSFPRLLRLAEGVVDKLSDRYIRRYNTSVGLKFLSSYDVIVTSRLHVMILAILLHKTGIFYIDNVSKKLSAFAETWLSDMEGVSPYIKTNVDSN